MAWEKVTWTCGHTGNMDLKGNCKSRQSTAEWYGDNYVCPDCYRAQRESAMAESHDAVVMHYGKYKELYADCRTKRDSYDSTAKTITVFVPRVPEIEIPEITETPVERADEIDGIAEMKSLWNGELEKRNEWKHTHHRAYLWALAEEWRSTPDWSMDYCKKRIATKYMPLILLGASPEKLLPMMNAEYKASKGEKRNNWR